MELQTFTIHSPMSEYATSLINESQCTGRADIDAHAAVPAAGYRIRSVELRLYDGLEPAVDKSENALAGLLFADPDAEVASDALALVALDALKFCLGETGMELALQTLRVAAQLVRVADEAAVRIVMATAL